MNLNLFRRIRGIVYRWKRKNFHKTWNEIEHGLDFFQEFADIYGDTINDIEKADIFFNDFIRRTQGVVNVDFLDTDNWDRIRKVEVDKQNSLIWFYYQIPSGEPIEDMMRKNVFPCDYHGMCLKFDNVSFLKDKERRCFAIVVNGYTIKEKNVKIFAQNGGWTIKNNDATSSFFSINVVREKEGVSQYWRFMNTPISSFWIIPKGLRINPQDSEKLLYMYGVKKCEKDLNNASENPKRSDNLSLNEQRNIIRTQGTAMRIVAECLFKLIVCFYQEEHQYKVGDYSDLKLGDLTKPLKKTIYNQPNEIAWINETAKIANNLAHDSGDPIDSNNLNTLFNHITYFIKDFESRIRLRGNGLIEKHCDKPSPHDFIKGNYKNFCFIDEINEIVSKTNGRISFEVETQIGRTSIDIFGENGAEVLCKDGYIRNSQEEGVEILKVWDRDEVVKLLYRMHQKVIRDCESKGYDTDLLLFEIPFKGKLKKEDEPIHLFTEKEIEKLMSEADDNNFNRLVIDENGYAHIIQNPEQGILYPVALETWCAGNMYVGMNSNLSDLHYSYVLSMHLWLDYLEKGQHMYSDYFVSDDGLDMVIEKVKKHYLNGNKI